MDNLSNIVEMWKEMDSKLSSLVAENRKLVDEIKKSKLRGSQEKLIRKYCAFIILEAVFIPLITLVLIGNPLVIEQYRWPALIYFVCFLLMEICIDGYLLYKMNSIDIYNDTIVEISRQARANWKIHKIAVLIGIPIAAGAVILFCMALGGDSSVIWGACVGGIIGLGIGLNQLLKFRKNYSAITNE